MISLAFASALTAKFTTESFDKQQTLLTAWDELRPQHRGTPFAQSPDFKTFSNPGELNPEFALDASNFIKFIRLTAGLDPTIQILPDLNTKAQWGANLLRLHGSIDHRVPKPSQLTMDQYAIASQGTAQSNISKFYGRRTDLVEMIHLQMIDDRANVWNVGHRRWLLNPYLRKVGLGFVQSGQIPTSYGAVVVSDQSGSRENPPAFVAWPSPHAFPLELTTPSMPWSITLNPDQYQKPIAQNLTIELTDSSTGKSWTFQPEDNHVRRTDAEFQANFCGRQYGFGPSIIFRPQGQNLYSENTEYEVQISGLKTAQGESTSITFRTRFFKLGSPVLLHQSPNERT